MNKSFLHPTQDVHIVGVFRSQAQADEAKDALKDAGFPEDHTLQTDYQGAHADDHRVLVHVLTADRDQEAVKLLVHHGANNADLPLGTELGHGDLMQYDSDAGTSFSQQPTKRESNVLPQPSEKSEL